MEGNKLMTLALDTVAPSLVKFSLTPVVDLSSGSGSLNFSVHGSDTSGIKSALVYFANGLTYSYTMPANKPDIHTRCLKISQMAPTHS